MAEGEFVPFHHHTGQILVGLLSAAMYYLFALQQKNPLVVDKAMAARVLSAGRNNGLMDVDKAMAAGRLATEKNNVLNKGGIDLTPVQINLQTKTDSRFSGQDNGIKFQLDPALRSQLQNASGFEPLIINIQPKTDLRQFLGLKENEKSLVSA